LHASCYCFALAAESYPCTIIAVGKKASADGSVIISHTDCGADSRIRVVHGQTFPAGSHGPCVHWGIQDIHRPLDDFGDVIGQIPQVESTFTYFHSAYPHMNEFQLAIAESTTSQREELKVDMAVCKQIMTVEQAQAFALQRYKTAREATAFIGHLMSTYGFLPSCVGESETLVIGDTEEIWIFEVFSVGSGWDPDSGEPGAIWVAQRIPDDHALVVANWSIIKEVDEEDTENFMVSPTTSSSPSIRAGSILKAAIPLSGRRSMPPCSVNGPPIACGFFTAPMPLPRGLAREDAGGRPHDGIQPVHPVCGALSIYPTSVKPEKIIHPGCHGLPALHL
jgi:dipeptidase